jgi:GTP:adenosylcobinamide-phosphate guanylyltransferase
MPAAPETRPEPTPRLPAVVTAGDRAAAKHVRGESKPYLAIEGRPLVAHVVATLQRVPEISEVWVVGDAARLAATLEPLRSELRKPLHVVPQFRNLYENAWETYRRLLPDAGPEGRDPASEDDLDQRVLYLSADIPFATPHEISHFVRLGVSLGCDYAVGLSTERSMEDFYPEARGAPGIRMAYFNLREGRFRQNNLHLVRPARLLHRFYIEEMYEHRHQKEFGEIAALAFRLWRTQEGGFRLLGNYLLLHAASIADRWGWRRIADWIRAAIPIARVERAVSSLLGTRFRFAVTELGGAAVDIDNDEDYEAARARFAEWWKRELAKGEARVGQLALPPAAGPPTIDVRPGGSPA